MLRVKTENLLTLLYLPIGIINITKADASLLVLTIMMQAFILISLFYGIRITRRELIKEIKAGEYTEEIEDIKKAIASFRRIKETIATKLEALKKEVIGSKLKTTKLKDAF